MNLLKPILIIFGTISLGLGILGIFIPGLPTTPFLLLTAGLYLRSSERLYQRVVDNPYVGRYIRDFHTNKGMSVRLKIISITLMWIMIASSCVFFIDNKWIEIGLILTGIIGSVVMGFVINSSGKTSE